jgi:hypothetical protein
LPNPGFTKIHFLIAAEDAAGDISIELYNFGGERVARLQGRPSASRHWLEWDCGQVAPGIYVARVVSNGREIARLKVAVKK